MAKEKICGIYCIENIVNGKKYIGQSVDIYNRKTHHFSELKNGIHYNEFLQNDFNTYKENNFIFYILIECDKDLLDQYEIFYINKFHTLDKNFGYNISPGGAHPHEFSELELKKRSESIKKKWSAMDEQTREYIISSLHNGHRTWLDNITDEEKASIYQRRSIALMSKSDVEKEGTNAKRVASIKIAIANRSKEKDEEIRRNYSESSKKRWDSTPQEVKEALRQTIIRKVYCPELDKVFDSIKEASILASTQSSNIVKVCRGERKFAGKLEDGTKLTWTYVEK